MVPSGGQIQRANLEHIEGVFPGRSNVSVSVGHGRPSAVSQELVHVSCATCDVEMVPDVQMRAPCWNASRRGRHKTQPDLSGLSCINLRCGLVKSSKNADLLDKLDVLGLTPETLAGF